MGIYHGAQWAGTCSLREDQRSGWSMFHQLDDLFLGCTVRILFSWELFWTMELVITCFEAIRWPSVRWALSYLNIKKLVLFQKTEFTAGCMAELRGGKGSTKEQGIWETVGGWKNLSPFLWLAEAVSEEDASRQAVGFRLGAGQWRSQTTSCHFSYSQQLSLLTGADSSAFSSHSGITRCLHMAWPPFLPNRSAGPHCLYQTSGSQRPCTCSAGGGGFSGFPAFHIRVLDHIITPTIQLYPGTHTETLWEFFSVSNLFPPDCTLF